MSTNLGKLCKSTAVPPVPLFNFQLTEVMYAIKNKLVS